MGAVLGFRCVMYLNGGTWTAPVWSAQSNVIDVKVGGEVDEADVSTRAGGGFTFSEPTLLKGGLDFNLVDDPNDTFLNSLRTAYLNRTALDLAVLNGAMNVSGTRGLRAEFKVFKFENGQPLKDKATFDVSLKPCYPDAATHTPYWIKIP